MYYGSYKHQIRLYLPSTLHDLCPGGGHLNPNFWKSYPGQSRTSYSDSGPPGSGSDPLIMKNPFRDDSWSVSQSTGDFHFLVGTFTTDFIWWLSSPDSWESQRLAFSFSSGWTETDSSDVTNWVCWSFSIFFHFLFSFLARFFSYNFHKKSSQPRQNSQLSSLVQTGWPSFCLQDAHKSCEYSQVPL